MFKYNLLAGALALGTVWAQPSLATASYDIVTTFSFDNSVSISEVLLQEKIVVFAPVAELEGNGTSGFEGPGGSGISTAVAVNGSAGAAPLPDFSSSAVTGEFLVEAASINEEIDLAALSFGFDIDLAISVTDPSTSAASAGYQVDVFAEDLLLTSLSGMIDEFDLVDGMASLSVNEAVDPFDLLSADFFIVQYTLFGDAVSVEVPEPSVAWLAGAGLLMLGASRLRR